MKAMATRQFVDAGTFVLVLFCGVVVSSGQVVNWANFADKIDPSGGLKASWSPESNTDFCSYSGISCESNVVTRISLPLKSFTGQIPDDPWSYLTNLTYLDLSNNSLTANIPGGLNNVKSLKELYLQNNKLTGPSLYLGNLENLESFDVSNNLLSEGMADFGPCSSLVTLKMGINQMTGGISYSIGACTKLTTLYLNDNNLAGDLPVPFVNLVNLQTLQLQNNPLLTGTVPVELTKLTDINIGNTQLSCGNGQSLPSCITSVESSPPPPLVSPPPPFPPLPPGTPTPPPSPVLISPSPPLAIGSGSSKSSSFGTGAIAGIAGGGAFALLVACLLLFFCCRRRRKEEDEDPVDKPITEGLSTPVESRDLEAGKVSPAKRVTAGPPRGGGWSSGGDQAGLVSSNTDHQDHQDEDPKSEALETVETPPFYVVEQKTSNPAMGPGPEATTPAISTTLTSTGAFITARANDEDEDDDAHTTGGYSDDVEGKESKDLNPSSIGMLHSSAGEEKLGNPSALQPVGEAEDDLPPVEELPKGDFPSLVVIPPVVDLPPLKSAPNKKFSDDTDAGALPPPSRKIKPEAIPAAIPPPIMYGPAGRALRSGDLDSDVDGQHLMADDEESLNEGGGHNGSWNASEPSEVSEDPNLGAIDRWFSLQELALATNNFGEQNPRNVLGTGQFGTVFKARLADGTTVAVKRLNLDKSTHQSVREFCAEVEAMCRLKHPNLVQLLGCCADGSERLLVYEYVPNYTLKSWLHQAANSEPIDWKLRMHIALGVARGLAYLHEGLDSKVVHRDIKSSNVLLDAQWNAKIGDFALAKILGQDQSHSTPRIMGTLGYVAPEYASTGLLTERSDVYSFGVLLLEIVTGRPPVDPDAEKSQANLVEWVKLKTREDKFSEVVDAALTDVQQDDAEYVINIALKCVESNALKRLKMAQVLGMLETEDPAMKDDWVARRPTPRASRENSPPTQVPTRFSPAWARRDPSRSSSPKGGITSSLSPRGSDVGSMIANAALKASSPRGGSPPAPGFSPRGVSPTSSRGVPTSPSGRQTSPRSPSPRPASPNTDAGALIASHAMSINSTKQRQQPTWSRRT